VNGVFCILEGEARFIKEDWTYTDGDDTMNKLKRASARQIDISLMQAGELAGYEEIIVKAGRRNHSLVAHSEIVVVLYISREDFIERVYNPHAWMKTLLWERFELSKGLHD
jgi:hypothetical protein